MRWASWARNTCHTVLTWLPGDQSPSPSRPEKKSVEDKEVRGALGVAGKKPHIEICGQSNPCLWPGTHLSVPGARQAVGLRHIPGH